MINLFAIVLVFSLLSLSIAITYQTGTFDLLQNNGCAAPRTIIFKAPFNLIPQVIAFFVKQDYLPNAGPSFSFSGVSQTGFVVTFDCTVPGIAGIVLQWIAVDDDRFEFISSFNNDVSNDLSKTFILPHSNPLHVQYFFGIINFNYGSLPTFDFNLDVTITSTDVTVTFTQATLSILSLGYYVVLGTADAFNLGSQKTLTHVTSGNQGHYTNLQSNQIKLNLFMQHINFLSFLIH